MKTCLNRLIGRCKNNCKADYDTSHHPNNYDCANYQDANIMEFEVQEAKKPQNYFKKFVLETLTQSSPVEELLKKVM